MGAVQIPKSVAQLVPSVLHFPDGGACVNHGKFWPQDASTAIDIGSGFYWEGWVKRWGTGYIISDSWGGAHSLLLGLNPKLSGNVWTGTTAIPYSGTYTPAVGEWVHFFCLWLSGAIYTGINGVPDGYNVFAGPRKTPTTASGAAWLLVGGSDHLNLPMDLSFLRGYDSGSPVASSSSGPVAFVPERFPGALPADGGMLPEFMVDYTAPSLGPIADHAPLGRVSSVGGDPIRHPGYRFNATDLGWSTYTNPPRMTRPPSPALLPYWVGDSTCPFGQPYGNATLPAENIPAPGSVPVGAKISDTFGRRNQTLAFQLSPSLGSTEGGSLGPKTWSQGMTVSAPIRIGKLWGILGGDAVFLDYGEAIAYVLNDSADMDVRITRDLTTGLTGAVGLCFRVVDKDNFWFATCLGTPNPNAVYVGKYVGGALTVDGGVSGLGSTWTQIRAVTSGTNVDIYVGDGSSWTSVVAKTGQTSHQTATGVGLFSSHQSYYPMGLARYKNFTVF